MRGSNQTGRTKGEDSGAGSHTIKLSLRIALICRTHRRREHLHCYQNPANAKAPAGRPKIVPVTAFSTQLSFPFQSSPFHITLTSLSFLLSLSKSEVWLSLANQMYSASINPSVISIFFNTAAAFRVSRMNFGPFSFRGLV